MGIKGCSKGKVLRKATGLNLKSIKRLNIGNRINIDGNLLFSQLQGSGGKTVEKTVAEMALFLKRISHCGGFIVTLVMDGKIRPDCKRATEKY